LLSPSPFRYSFFDAVEYVGQWNVAM
jgi:hypothetical protein